MSGFVQLNVGGVLHTTSRETLLREPSSRLALMARGVLPCPAAQDGTLLLDRSPRFFQTSEWLPRRHPSSTCSAARQNPTGSAASAPPGCLSQPKAPHSPPPPKKTLTHTPSPQLPP